MMKRLLALLLILTLLPASALTEAAVAADTLPESFVCPVPANEQIDSLLNRALEYLLADEPDHALACTELARMMDARYPGIYAVLAKIHYASGEMMQARENAVRITELAPSWAVGWRFLFELSEPAEAENILRYLDVLDAVDEQYYLQLADGFAQLENWEKAAKYFDQCDLSWLNEEQRRSALAIMENLLIACGYDLPEK